MKKTYSILRAAQEKEISKLTLGGEILDVGGDATSTYQKLIAGSSNIHSINISPEYHPDEIVDIETTFPYSDATYDHVICFNVLEHIVETQHAISEMVRVVKPGGQIVITTPFLYYIHGSPDDYQRYTSSFYKKMAEKYGCTVESITPLGSGFLSIGFSFIGGVLPTLWFKLFCKSIVCSLDAGLCRISSKYRKLTDRLPMGYFVVFTKD